MHPDDAFTGVLGISHNLIFIFFSLLQNIPYGELLSEIIESTHFMLTFICVILK